MILRFCFLFIIVFLSSCNRDKSTLSQGMDECLLYIFLLYSYSDTPVTVYVDKYPVLEDTISTRGIPPFAKSITARVDQGLHQLGAKIENNIFSDTTFVIDDTLYAEIYYDRYNSKISFRFRHEPFPYR